MTMQSLRFNLTSLGSGPPHHPASPGIRCKCITLLQWGSNFAAGDCFQTCLRIDMWPVFAWGGSAQVSSAKQQLTQAIATNERISGSIYVDVNFSSHPSISVYHCLSICTMRPKHKQNWNRPVQTSSIHLNSPSPSKPLSAALSPAQLPWGFQCKALTAGPMFCQLGLLSNHFT